jgi:hypothetical protein
MKNRFALLFAVILLASCTTTVEVKPGEDTQKDPDTEEVTEDPVSSDAMEAGDDIERETKNVSYRGIIQPSGISIFMQGSHRLVLSDGRFILLESDSVDLNGYVGEETDVTGAVRPTVEAGGTIMRVEEAKLVVAQEKDEEGNNEGAVSDERLAVSNDAEDEQEMIEESLDSDNDSARDVQKPEPASEDPEPEPASSKEPISYSEEALKKIKSMSQEKFTVDQWTQEYCTSHLRFCLPVHRNWWYKSFGTTASALWHLEIGNSPVLSIGDGPIVINLLRGDISDEQNMSVTTEGDTVVGFHTWSDDRHFEIRAHKDLTDAVTYMTKNLAKYQGE